MSATPESKPSMGFFVTVTTPKGVDTKKIEGDTLSVGRASDCELSIQHEALSRRHLSVTLRDSQCLVEDHGSSNGSFVNGKRIKAHTPMPILATDVIQLGQSGVSLTVAPVVPAPVVRKKTVTALPPTPVEESLELPNDTIVTSTISERRLKSLEKSAAVEPRMPVEAQAQAEKILQDAQKRVTNLLQEAEMDAERRVQDIYRRAHETQAKMDEVYQRRMNEAYRTAEEMLQKSQGESEAILIEARKKAGEIRTQGEGFIQELRARTEADCERILEEAQKTARELKENRLLEADEIIRKKEEKVLADAQDGMNLRIARFEEDLLQDADRQRAALVEELERRREQIELDHKEQIDLIAKLKKESNALAEKRDEHQVKVRALEERTAELENSKLKASEANDRLSSTLTETQQELNRQKAELEKVLRSHNDAKVALSKVQTAEKDLEGQLQSLRSKFQDDKAKIERDEVKLLEERKLETTRRVRVLEESLLHEVHEKKERLGREVGLNLEAYFKENKIEGVSSREVQALIHKSIDSQITNMSTDPAAKNKQASLVKLRRREKFRTALVGLSLGVAATFGGLRAEKYVTQTPAPMQRKVASEAAERKADLERRKFAPPQTKDLKSSYSDSVIYTEGFVTTYLDDDFQKKFQTALTAYMLKTWRLEEEKSIETLAIARTLVKGLSEKREGIHPDFVSQGLDKMRELEDEAVTRLRDHLGTQVRYESFRKFEKKFYQDFHAGST